jgi:hypothetical protein
VSSGPDEVTGFLNSPKTSATLRAQVLTQPLTEMSTRNLAGSKGRPAREADNLIVICVPSV